MAGLVYIRVNGIVLNIELQGRGEPAILIPDIGEDLTSWCQQMRPFSGAHFTVALDNRGSGWSDSPDEEYTIEAMAQDVVCLMDALGVDTGHLVGVGLGGMVAQEIAARRPGRVTGLIMASSGARPTAQQREVYTKWVRATLEGTDPAEISRRMVPWLYSPSFLEDPGWREHVIRTRARKARWTSPQGISNQLRAMLDYDSRERLTGVRAPSLIIAGSDDRLCPPGEAAGELGKLIHTARTAQVEAGHLLNVEAFPEFNRLVLGFMAQTEGGETPPEVRTSPGPGCL